MRRVSGQAEVGVENFFLFHRVCSIRTLMTVLISALAFFVLLSFLVLIHEFGHFIAARKSGVIVEEFGFGLPPRAKSLFTKGGTLFSLNWIPFGGFVRLRGENAVTRADRERPGSFARAIFPAKVLILTAGVIMNFLVAMVIFTAGFSLWQWVPTYLTSDELLAAREAGDVVMDLGVTVTSVTTDGTAAATGLKPGSRILRVNGTQVYEPGQILAIQEGKASVEYEVLAPEQSQPTTLTIPLRDGRAGMVLQSPEVVSPPRSPVRAFVLALREAKVMTVQTVQGLGNLGKTLVTQGTVPEGVTGIVGIAVMTHDTVQHGWLQYLRLVAVLSLSLAILNILPFPALDGGRLVFVVYEFIVRRPAPRKFELVTNSAGFIFLIALILLITYHDILSLFP